MIIFVVVGAVLAGLIVVLASVGLILATRDEYTPGSGQAGDAGVPAEDAGCEADTFEDGSDNGHVPVGARVEYPQTPPASGRHWGNFLTGLEVQPVYTIENRPEVERLVHSLEHGYTVLWFDDGIYDDPDQLQELAEIGADAPFKFIAAPWTPADGDPFPDGIDVILAHWSFGDSAEGAEPAAYTAEVAELVPGEDRLGVRRACAELSSEVIRDFMAEWPYTDSLEPNGP